MKRLEGKEGLSLFPILKLNLKPQTQYMMHIMYLAGCVGPRTLGA